MVKDKQSWAVSRQDMPEQDPQVRRSNFKEVPLGYSEETAILEAKRCLQCKKPNCVKGCPVEVDIPGFIKHIADGDFSAAVRTIWQTNSLPAVCGRVCPQEVQCEGVCILTKRGGEAVRVVFEDGLHGRDADNPDALAVHEALERLAAVDPTRARIIELRFFGGLTQPEIAEVLGLSLSTVERRWRLARAWLLRELG